jgi:preprotein translocase subunit SecG
MVTVVIVIHLMVVLAMIGLVLLQRSDGGALGIGGGGGGNFLSGRGAGNVLTRSTAIFACAFFATSIALTVLARMESRPSDILDRLSTDAPVTAPAAPAPVAPAPSDAPSAQSVLDSLGAPQPTQEPAPAASVPAPADPAPAPSATEPAPAAPAGTTGQGQ